MINVPTVDPMHSARKGRGLGGGYVTAKISHWSVTAQARVQFPGQSIWDLRRTNWN
jgi:hypothetical protein